MIICIIIINSIIYYNEQTYIILYSLGIELTVSNILLALEKVTDPYLLGIQLGIEPHLLETFKVKHHLQSTDTERQKIEVIKLLLNNKNCSWKTLADAVKDMNNHGKVVDSLTELHRRATNMQDEVISHAL